MNFNDTFFIFVAQCYLDNVSQTTKVTRKRQAKLSKRLAKTWEQNDFSVKAKYDDFF